MNTKRTQLSLADRQWIELLLGQGCSQAGIAERLGRPRQTVSQELRRNSTRDGYCAQRAHRKARRRRARLPRLETDLGLRVLVRWLLERGYTPEQACAWLRLGFGRQMLHHNSIYNYARFRARRYKDRSWLRLLTRKGSTRRGRNESMSSAHNIRNRRHISERPAIVAERLQFGHWECDVMHCADSYVLVAVEMVTRFALVEHIHDRKSETILGVLLRWFGELPEAARRTITFDNGTEFSQHYGLCDILGMDTYFCSVGAPHERGGVENFQGRLRRDLPRGMKLKERPEWYVAACGAKHNGMLRKCLKWDTPAQAMERELSLLGL